MSNPSGNIYNRTPVLKAKKESRKRDLKDYKSHRTTKFDVRLYCLEKTEKVHTFLNNIVA